jgi:hypothetical protein
MPVVPGYAQDIIIIKMDLFYFPIMNNEVSCPFLIRISNCLFIPPPTQTIIGVEYPSNDPYTA